MIISETLIRPLYLNLTILNIEFRIVKFCKIPFKRNPGVKAQPLISKD
jgi:hypothetical protein